MLVIPSKAAAKPLSILNWTVACFISQKIYFSFPREVLAFLVTLDRFLSFGICQLSYYSFYYGHLWIQLTRFMLNWTTSGIAGVRWLWTVNDHNSFVSADKPSSEPRLSLQPDRAHLRLHAVRHKYMQSFMKCQQFGRKRLQQSYRRTWK